MTRPRTTPNDHEITPDEADAMDDAIHILYPGNTTLTMCGSTDRDNRIPITEPWPDGWSGCWTCLQEAEKIAPRPVTS